MAVFVVLKIMLEIDGFFRGLLFVWFFHPFQIGFVFALKTFDSPLQLLLGQFSLHVEIQNLNQFFHLPKVEIKTKIFHEFVDILSADPVVPAVVDGQYHSADGVILIGDELSSEFYYFHFPSHNFQDHLSENCKLLHNCVLLWMHKFRSFDSFRHELSKFEVVFGEEEGSKFEATDLPCLQIIHPGERIGQQFSMRSANQPAQIPLAYKPFLLLVDKSEEWEDVIVGNISQGLAIGFHCLVYEGHLRQNVGQEGSGFYR